MAQINDEILSSYTEYVKTYIDNSDIAIQKNVNALSAKSTFEIQVNNGTYKPTNGVINLGQIGGGSTIESGSVAYDYAEIFAYQLDAYVDYTAHPTIHKAFPNLISIQEVGEGDTVIWMSEKFDFVSFDQESQSYVGHTDDFWEYSPNKDQLTDEEKELLSGAYVYDSDKSLKWKKEEDGAIFADELVDALNETIEINSIRYHSNFVFTLSGNNDYNYYNINFSKTLEYQKSDYFFIDDICKVQDGKVYMMPIKMDSCIVTASGSLYVKNGVSTIFSVTIYSTKPKIQLEYDEYDLDGTQYEITLNPTSESFMIYGERIANMCYTMLPLVNFNYQNISLQSPFMDRIFVLSGGSNTTQSFKINATSPFDESGLNVIKNTNNYDVTINFEKGLTSSSTRRWTSLDGDTTMVVGANSLVYFKMYTSHLVPSNYYSDYVQVYVKRIDGTSGGGGIDSVSAETTATTSGSVAEVADNLLKLKIPYTTTENDGNWLNVWNVTESKWDKISVSTLKVEV